jgi:hypothetical protein
LSIGDRCAVFDCLPSHAIQELCTRYAFGKSGLVHRSWNLRRPTVAGIDDFD